MQIHLTCCFHIIGIAGKVERGSFMWAFLRLTVFIFASITNFLFDPSSSGIKTSQDRVRSSHKGERTALVEVKCALRGRIELNILSVRDITTIIISAGKDHAVVPLLTQPGWSLLVKSSSVQISIFLDASDYSDTIALVNVEGGPSSLCLDA